MRLFGACVRIVERVRLDLWGVQSIIAEVRRAACSVSETLGRWYSWEAGTRYGLRYLTLRRTDQGEGGQ